MLVNITIPVYNEETRLPANVEKLLRFVGQRSDYHYEIVIADNGSNDRTLATARDMERLNDCVHVIHLMETGRGRALKKAWSASKAEILSYMDVDLSSDIDAFPRLIEGLRRGESDIAVGSRLLPESTVRRSLWRTFLSRGYNVLLKAVFKVGFSDAQCGFKALTRDIAEALLPLVQDTAWFFDTELLVIATSLGFRIRDVPISWVEDADSRVMILRTVAADLKGLLRLRRRLLTMVRQQASVRTSTLKMAPRV